MTDQAAAPAPGNTLSWPEVAARLAAARTYYWLNTPAPRGAPHAAPVWGVAMGRHPRKPARTAEGHGHRRGPR